MTQSGFHPTHTRSKGKIRVFGNCTSRCTNTNTTRFRWIRQKNLWEGKDVKKWGAESCTISMLKGGCFSWTPWGWATEWRMWVGFIKPLHMQETISPQARHGWHGARRTRAFWMPCMVLGTWRVLEFSGKGNIQSQAQRPGRVFCWVPGSCGLYHSHRHHHHKDKQSLGGEGSSSIFATFWLCHRRWSPTCWACCLPACLTILEWNLGDSAMYYCYFKCI